MAGFLGCSDWWWVWWRSAWVTGFGGDRPLWVTGFGGARCGSLGLVEIGALLLPSLPGKAEILSSNLLALPLRIAKGLPHPKSLSYIGNLDKLPVVIIALSKFPNGKSLGSLSQSFTPWCTVSLLCATTFLCRLTGFGLDQRGSASWVWIVGLGSVDGGFGLVDRWVWNGGSVDRWVDRLGWSSVAPMVAPMMIFGYFRRPGFQIGSVDGSVCVCVCVALLMALLALSDRFFFFFLIWVFVPLEFWWAVGNGGLDFSGFLFWWVCVCHTSVEGEREEGILCWTGVEGEREEKKDCWKSLGKQKFQLEKK